MQGADHPHATAIATAKVTPIIGDLSSEGRCSDLGELGRPFPGVVWCVPRTTWTKSHVCDQCVGRERILFHSVPTAFDNCGRIRVCRPTTH
jgi:hypothetical protein